MNDFVRDAVMVLVPMILSLTVHEYAHAIVALRLGDTTAQEQGRVTLSPVSHIDPIGSLIVPMVLLASGGASFFGWARPVPYNPLRFAKSVPMRRGTMLVALAGPSANVVFAVLVTVTLGLAMRLHAHVQPAFLVLAERLIVVNVGLGFFNLLPVPPLDGAKVLWGLLSPKAGDRYNALMDQAGSVAFIGAVLLGGSLLATPIIAVSRFLVYFLLPVIRGV